MQCSLIPSCFITFLNLISWTCSRRICFIIKSVGSVIRLVLHVTWIFYLLEKRRLFKRLLGRWRSLMRSTICVASLGLGCPLTCLSMQRIIGCAFELGRGLIGLSDVPLFTSRTIRITLSWTLLVGSLFRVLLFKENTCFLFFQC